jgi:replicative DNA helicase
MEQLTNFMAEEAVIGGVLLDSNSDNALYAIETCKPNDFSYREYAVAWQAIQKLSNTGKPVELVTVHELMQSKGIEGALGLLGDAYRNTVSQASLKNHADTVRKYSQLRQAAGALNQALSILFDARVNADDKINLALSELANIGAEDSEQQIMNLSDHQASLLSRMETIYQQGSTITGLSTGFENLDHMTGGLRKGDLVIVAARPSVGKTTLALNILERIAITSQQPQQALFFSLEMPAEQILQKVYASVGGIPLARILNAQVIGCKQQTSKLSHAMEFMQRSKLLIDDKSGQHITQIQSRAKRMVRRFGPLALIVVDYLQLIRAEGENQTIRIGNVSAGLKNLAKQMACPVIALSQLNRSLNGKPNLMNLRDSGSIEQDADMVIFLHDEDCENDRDEQSLTEIIFAKNRMGITGSTYLQPELHFSRFADTKRLPAPQAEPQSKVLRRRFDE